jgi:UDP-glucuronate 4-epimerase
VYSHLYGIRFIGLRFFTVYGPRQRPDLAIHKFSRMILAGEAIPFYGNGDTSRDYSYIDDIISGIHSAIHYRDSRYEILNLGNDRPVTLNELVECIEQALGRKAVLKRLPEQPGDVPHTRADVTKSAALLGYHAVTPLSVGIGHFVEWLKTEGMADK